MHGAALKSKGAGRVSLQSGWRLVLFIFSWRVCPNGDEFFFVMERYRQWFKSGSSSTWQPSFMLESPKNSRYNHPFLISNVCLVECIFSTQWQSLMQWRVMDLVYGSVWRIKIPRECVVCVACWEKKSHFQLHIDGAEISCACRLS